jgi:hypothetical protein
VTDGRYDECDINERSSSASRAIAEDLRIEGLSNGLRFNTQVTLTLAPTPSKKFSDADFPYFSGWRKINGGGGSDNAPFGNDGICNVDELKKSLPVQLQRRGHRKNLKTKMHSAISSGPTKRCVKSSLALFAMHQRNGIAVRMSIAMKR